MNLRQPTPRSQSVEALRAAASQQDTNSAAVATDLQVAQGYKTYLANAEPINLLMR